MSEGFAIMREAQACEKWAALYRHVGEATTNAKVWQRLIKFAEKYEKLAKRHTRRVKVLKS